MLKKVILNLVFSSILFYFPVFAEIKICDKANINPNWQTINDICNGWILLDNIVWLTNFSWSYLSQSWWYWGQNHSFIKTGVIYNTRVWYLWNKNNYTKTNGPINNFHVWYLWNSFWEKTIKSVLYDTPVWYFSNYRNTNIVFPSVESVIYRSVNPLIRPVNTSPSSWWGYAPNCPVPPRTENLKIELKKDSEERDYIKLNWDGIDTEDITRLIVLRYSPNSLHIEIDKNSSFYEEKNLNEWNTYHYQVFSYNDCGGLAYSDSVKIVYKKDDSLEEHLSVKSALEIIYPNSSSWASIELYRDIYYLYDKIDLDENLNYWDLSLLLINIKWWVFFEDRILALKLLNRLWYIPYGVEIEELVTSESFVSLLAYVNSIIDFQGKIIRWVDKVFELNSEERDYIKLNWDGIDTEDITRLIVLRYSPKSSHHSNFKQEKIPLYSLVHSILLASFT